MQHTPGPWATLKRIGSADSRLHATLNDDASDAYVIVAAADPDEEAANARLIAAAPELLAALLDALPYVEDVLSDPAQLAAFKPGTVQRHAKAIRAAIAAATGQA